MTALLVAHRFPWPPIPCSPHAPPTQVGHWEFFGGRLDHSNETQTHHPHDCHSIDGRKV